VGHANSRRCGVRGPHGLDCGEQPSRPGVAAHVPGQHDSGAERFGQDQLIPGLQPGFPQDFAGIDQTGNGKTQRRFGRFAAVTAHQRATGLAQDFARTQQHG
jgi:hypothetical protein